MESHIKVNFKLMRSKAMVNIFQKKRKVLEIGKKINYKAWGKLYGAMEKFMKANMKMIKKMDSEYLNGKMEESI